ncbi:hypothetical protein KP509_04G068500 [Ceratopteris richardii]|uniref:Uncharacterized protein n=1 Tax=Ceratopteris richardii TaxID=49495 RepID=A0A8T2UWH4_CERRI|nr:hypothetical protein KP509_04G068500 [Ceratopteris richardii]KAH7439611.1 hypothetical protein KP509_04G068500 [Ceratopteris richardii]KAH7439612.1 hypothetical protein KP509_04G068500 [Ceratopteris richardii]KAH7439613.1 hypothetical protein KP509_04G068500 [Ceratopteris richardii]
MASCAETECKVSATQEVGTETATDQIQHKDSLSSSGFFDFSTISSLLNDPSLRGLVEQISNDPAFGSMAKQLQSSSKQSGKGDLSESDTDEYFDAMKIIMQNPEFMKIAEKLGTSLIQNPIIANVIQNPGGLDCKDQHKPHLNQSQDESTVKTILSEIEAGGPLAASKYWNDPVVLSKLGQAMGVGATCSFETGEEIIAAVEEHEHDNESSIHYFASVGKLEDLKSALRDGACEDVKDSDGRTALHLACGYGELKCAEALLVAGASPDALDEDHNTPLHYAASYGQYACAELLLKKGASIKAQNLDGSTPLEIAQFNNQDEVSYLLEQAAMSS